MTSDDDDPKPKSVQRTYAGDRLVQNPSDSRFALIIESKQEKRGWASRVTEAHKAAFPGSTIEFEGRLYEVLEISQKEEPFRYRYFLGAWEDRFPIRRRFQYTREDILRESASRQEEIRGYQNTFLIHVLSPVLGLFPAKDQVRIENSYGITATKLTTISAFATLFLGGVGIFLNLKHYFGVPFPGPDFFHPLFKACPYLFGESFLRLYSSLNQDEPMGSFPVWFSVEAYRAIRQQFSSEYKRKRLEQFEDNAEKYTEVVDEIRIVSNKDYDLEIISKLPKPHWTTLTGIRYDNVWYGLLESREVRERIPGYVFHLKRAPEGTVFRTTSEYTPDEIQREYHKKRLQDMSTWVDTFSIFWGLLDEDHQNRLTRLYGYNGLKYSLWTSVVIGLTGVFNLVASITSFYGHVATTGDTLWAIASGYFLFESYGRLRKWKRGRPSGSVLGILFQPFVAPLLKGL